MITKTTLQLNQSYTYSDNLRPTEKTDSQHSQFFMINIVPSDIHYDKKAINKNEKSAITKSLLSRRNLSTAEPSPHQHQDKSRTQQHRRIKNAGTNFATPLSLNFRFLIYIFLTSHLYIYFINYQSYVLPRIKIYRHKTISFFLP